MKKLLSLISSSVIIALGTLPASACNSLNAKGLKLETASLSYDSKHNDSNIYVNFKNLDFKTGGSSTPGLNYLVTQGDFKISNFEISTPTTDNDSVSVTLTTDHIFNKDKAISLTYEKVTILVTWNIN